jgi:hypothetical protein
VCEVVGRLGVALVLVLTLGGCGFVHAGSAGKSKPNGFVLRGYASVAGATAGSAGTACVAPPTVPDVAPSTPVKVTDPGGKALATGQLGAGVLAVDSSAYRCNFPFEIRAVPGGEDRYVITVGDRPAVTFPAADLREDKPAVIDVRAS